MGSAAPVLSVANLEAIHFGKANTMPEIRGQMAIEAAEHLAIRALSFLATQPEALGRFLALAGIGPAMLRQAAADPAFLVGVLDYFLSDEPALVAFAADAGIRPTEIAIARRALDHHEPAR